MNGCKDAATADSLGAGSVVQCKDAATGNFQRVVSVARFTEQLPHIFWELAVQAQLQVML